MKNYLLILMLFICTLGYAEESNNDFINQEGTTQVQNDIKIVFLNGKLTVENAPINSALEIFSMVGVSVFQEVVIDTKQDFLLNLNKGYYVVKLAGITKKISVR